MKAVVAAFNQEKALVGAFSVITNLRMELFEALLCSNVWHDGDCSISRGLESGLQRGPQRSPGEARTANCVVDKQNQNLTAYEIEKLGISFDCIH